MAYITMKHAGVREVPDEELQRYKDLGYDEASDEELAAFVHGDVYGGLQGAYPAPPIRSHLGHHLLPADAGDIPIPTTTRTGRDKEEMRDKDVVEVVKDNASRPNRPNHPEAPERVTAGPAVTQRDTGDEEDASRSKGRK